MCRWAPPYFPGLESMAARKNGVYLADEHGGESGRGAAGSARPLWRSSAPLQWCLHDPLTRKLPPLGADLSEFGLKQITETWILKHFR